VWPQDNTLVVLKEVVLLRGDVSNPAEAEKRKLDAIRESETLLLLDHANVISYFDTFENDGVLLIEMEYADGGTLWDKVRHGLGCKARNQCTHCRCIAAVPYAWPNPWFCTLNNYQKQ
jgi:serine/threonine protein kinase